MAAEPYALEASLTLPPDDGQPNATLEAAVSGTFTQKTSHKLAITGAGTHVVGFGTLASPGVKGIFLEYPNISPALSPINVRVNGGATDMEISPGGFLVYSNPSPTAGLTAMSIITTAAAMVRVTLLA